ncbi:MAG: PAS domain-containing protein [Cytophagales bacterium]
MKKIWSTINGKLSLSVMVVVILGLALLVTISTIKMYSIEKEKAIQSAGNIALEIGSEIKNEINTLIGNVMFLTNTLHINTFADEETKFTRKQVNLFLKNNIEKNPTILGFYTLWEPNAFDGKDEEFVNQEGHDESGRFLPYWVRHKNGSVNLEPLIGYDDPTADYYQIPKKSGKTAIIDPYWYPIDGKEELVISIINPILNQGNSFKGLAGVDLSIDWINNLVKNHQNNNFKENLNITIVTKSGKIITSSLNDSLTLKPVIDFFPSEMVSKLNTEIAGAVSIDGMLYVYKPIEIANNSWYVIISVPKSFVFKELYSTLTWNIFLGILFAGSIIALVFYVSNNLTKPIINISKKAEDLSIGQKVTTSVNSDTIELKKLEESFSKIIDSQNVLTEVCKKVADGDYSQELKLRSENDELFDVVNQMVKSLKRADEEEKIRSWTSEGLAKFAELLRKVDNDAEIYDKILAELIRYVGANQGAIYINNEEERNNLLVMRACYAYNRKKYLNQSFSPGEGLAGQVFQEKEEIYLTEIPEKHIKIGSGLGDARPRSLFITPLLSNEKMNGVLELASFEYLPEYKRIFINKVAESLSSFISMKEISEKTMILLEETKTQAEEMRAQEEEMRQNLEEMQATQEELSRKNKEIIEMTSKSEGILRGLNLAMASVQFDTNRNITDANSNFLNLFGIDLKTAKSLNHKQLMPLDSDNKDYENFWNNLLVEGKAFTGLVKRKKPNGEILWLSTIYTPLKDENNVVTSVMKFAIDVTESKKNEDELAKYNTLLSEREKVFNFSTILSESDEFGTITFANEKLEKVSKYSREEMIGKGHNLFRDPEMPKKLFELMWENLKVGKEFSAVLRNKAKDGSYYWVDGKFIPIINESGKILKIVGARYHIENETIALMAYNLQAEKLGLPKLKV